MNSVDESSQGYLYVVSPRGYSAYEIAVQNGYEGTEEEWLASLEGPQGIQGIDGKSAYEVAVDNGYEGTEEEWVNSYINADNYYNKQEVDEKIQTVSHIYENTNDMLEDSSLKVGDYVITSGYYNKNDGGAGEYVILKTDYTLIIDNGSLFQLNNGLYARLLVKDNVYPEQWGCRGNGSIDDTTEFQKCLNYAGLNHKTIILTKVYLVNNLKLKAFASDYIYDIEGRVSKQLGRSDQALKNGFLTRTSVFNTDTTLGTSIQIHLKEVNADGLDATGSYTSFIEKCHLERSTIINCNCNGFDYIINGSCNINTIIESNNFKNIKKACFKVYTGSPYGFYDCYINGNYINAAHFDTQGFHGYPSKRTCVLLDDVRTGFGVDTRFTNNFVDYFTYFIDKGESYELPKTDAPVYSNKYAGLVSGNVFQNMLNMIGIGVVLCGNFSNNLFDNFCRSTIYNYLNNTNSGPFSVATYTCELNDNGDNTETFPFRKFANIVIEGNHFQECPRPVYYDFTYSEYPNVSASSMVAENCVIENNEMTSGNDKFNSLSVFATQYNDRVFKYTRCQLWDNICMPDTASTSYYVVHSGKLHAREGSIAQFSDGIFIAVYVAARNYKWQKISDITVS